MGETPFAFVGIEGSGPPPNSSNHQPERRGGLVAAISLLVSEQNIIIVPSHSEVLHKNEILFVASYLAAVLLFGIGPDLFRIDQGDAFRDDMRPSVLIRDMVTLLAVGVGLCGVAEPAARANARPPGQKAGNAPDQAANFSEADAARVFDGLRQALESNNERRLLKLFDATRMPDYPAFRDQVAQFFDEYEAFLVRYHIAQVSTEGQVGVVTADFEVEATPSRGTSPNIRRNMQLRLVLAWDGRQWKIVSLTPRGLFR